MYEQNGDRKRQRMHVKGIIRKKKVLQKGNFCSKKIKKVKVRKNELKKKEIKKMEEEMKKE